MFDRRVEGIEVGVEDGRELRGGHAVTVANMCSFDKRGDDRSVAHLGAGLVVDGLNARVLFGQIGPVHSAAVITDRETGRSRGFGFVEMDENDAETAISQLNGKYVGGRSLRVNEAVVSDSLR